MEYRFMNKVKKAWNAFVSEETYSPYLDAGGASYIRPDRPRLTRGNERSMVTAVYNRIAVDCASIDMKHVMLDEKGRYLKTIPSSLNNCLTVEANIDQSGRNFIMDAVMSLLDEGNIALVPIDTTTNPNKADSFSIHTIRTGRIVTWYPSHVKVNVYNDRTGKREDILMHKSAVAIVENPFYAVMNEQSSTIQRLIRKLNLLDAVDEQSSSGKLDLVIQLPYVVKTEARRKQAEERRKNIEDQLTGSKYGIAYTDGSERITQLNRPVENNLMKQIEYLTNMMYSQLGITQSVLDGTADEKTMLNYFSRTIEPIMTALRDAMYRSFLTKTARTQGQSIVYFRDPFKLVPVSDLAEITDKMTRNEVMTSNEIRQTMGMMPADDPNADKLHNSNIRAADASMQSQNGSFENGDSMSQEEFDSAMDGYDELDAQLSDMESALEHSELLHYASKYYDPVKAHEYYMRTRKLKGRDGERSAPMNDAGREAKSYVSKNVREEFAEKRKKHNEDTKNTLSRMRSETRSKIEDAQNDTKQKIEQLQNILESLDDDERSLKSPQFKRVIASMRERNRNESRRLAKAFNAESETVRSDYKVESERINQEYKETLERELNAIQSESQFHKSK